MSIEDEYADVLQNIETAIVAVHGEEPDLLDLEVLDALQALIREYTAEERGKAVGAPRLSGRARKLYDTVGRTCEWRLGRGPLNPGEPAQSVAPGALAASEIVLCLKRIRRSVELWNKEGGRQGYLNYIRPFLAQITPRRPTRP